MPLKIITVNNRQVNNLIIDQSSHLTTYDCNNLWKGIDVLGDPSLSQEGADASLQGELYMRDSEISKAYYAITNYDRNEWYKNPTTSGGIILVENSSFTNCRSAVKTAAFTNNNGTPPTSSVRIDFYNCNFDWTTDFVGPMYNELFPMADLFGVYGVTFSGCNFENQSTLAFYGWDQYQRKAAIYSEKSRITVKDGCAGYLPYPESCTPSVPSTIKGFMYGVTLISNPVSKIEDTDFECFRGVWAFNCTAPKFASNNFSELPSNVISELQAIYPDETVAFPQEVSWQAHYGIFTEYSSGYWIEDNHVEFSGVAESIGIGIRASGSAQNRLYRNTLENCSYGTVAFDDNRGLSNSEGLKLECNEYLNNSIEDINVSATGIEEPGWGISHHQGIQPEGTEQGLSAGNKFQIGAVFNLRNNLDNVIYFHHSNENFEIYNGISAVLITSQHQCESELQGLISVKPSKASLHREAMTELEDLLSSLIDGGNTQDLLTDVILTQYGDALALYYDLMAKSPNLSQEVMLEAINKEVELPAVLLTLILESNPHAAKSSKVQKKLDNRTSPLTDYQRYMIDQGLNLISSKEALTARLSHHANLYKSILDQIVIEVISNDEVTDKLGTLAALLGDMESLDQRYLITDLLLESGDITAAQSALSNVSTDFYLDTRKDQEYVDYQDCYAIKIDRISTGNDELTANQISALQTIAYKHSTRAAGMARSLLMEYGADWFDEVLINPANVQKSMKVYRDWKFETSEEVKIYPNPTSDVITLEYRGNKKIKTLLLTDIHGRQVNEIAVDSSQAYYLIDLRSLATGKYTLKIVYLDNSNTIKTIEKL